MARSWCFLHIAPGKRNWWRNLSKTDAKQPWRPMIWFVIFLTGHEMVQGCPIIEAAGPIPSAPIPNGRLFFCPPVAVRNRFLPPPVGVTIAPGTGHPTESGSSGGPIALDRDDCRSGCFQDRKSVV